MGKFKFSPVLITNLFPSEFSANLMQNFKFYPNRSFKSKIRPVATSNLISKVQLFRWYSQKRVCSNIRAKFCQVGFHTSGTLNLFHSWKYKCRSHTRHFEKKMHYEYKFNYHLTFTQSLFRNAAVAEWLSCSAVFEPRITRPIACWSNCDIHWPS